VWETRSYCGKTRRHPQNRKYVTYRNTTGEGPNHTDTGNMDRKCGEVRTIVTEIFMQTYRRTDSQFLQE